MSIPVTLVPGTLPYSCYPDNPQSLNVDIVTRIVAVLSTTFAGLYISASAPPADQRDKIWFNSTNQRLYQWINGAWQRKYQFEPLSSIRLAWKGSLLNLKTFDGGDTGGVGDSTGPLWEPDTDFDDRIPIGIGTTICTDYTGAGSTYGSKQHTLTEAEGATGAHTHAFGNYDSGAADLNFTSSFTVPSYTGAVVQGISGGPVTGPDTTADLFTLPCGTDGKGVTATPFDIVPPVRGVYWIKRTSRVYVPAPY